MFKAEQGLVWGVGSLGKQTGARRDASPNRSPGISQSPSLSYVPDDHVGKELLPQLGKYKMTSAAKLPDR